MASCAKGFVDQTVNSYKIRDLGVPDSLFTLGVDLPTIIFPLDNFSKQSHMSYRLFLAGVLPLLFIGCGPESKMATINGTVTIDGKAPATGSISFVAVDGLTPNTGTTITDGKFTSEVPIGESKVEIRVSKVVGKKKLYDTPDSPEQEIMEEILPAKYNEQTELRVTAQKGVNEKNFDLTTK
jgi:hypothetical protein